MCTRDAISQVRNRFHGEFGEKAARERRKGTAPAGAISQRVSVSPLWLAAKDARRQVTQLVNVAFSARSHHVTASVQRPDERAMDVISLICITTDVFLQRSHNLTPLDH